DFAVPQLLRAARRTADLRRPPCVTLSDHAWSDTLTRMATAADLLSEPVQRALDAMRADEALATAAFTLPEPITPPAAARYWPDVLHVPVQRLPGVLGGPEATRSWIAGEPREAVRRLLGVEDGLPVLHITGGGTAVWDNALARLLSDYCARPPGYHVIVFHPAEARRRDVRMAWSAAGGAAVELGRDPALPRVTFLGDVRGETHHVLFAGFDLLCTRAGGGTVNDALAFRVPMVLVEEPGHAQVEAIRESCEQMGLCRSTRWEEFLARGRALWEGAGSALIRIPGAAAAAAAVERYAEAWLAHRLLEMASDDW
ncbi:MAG: hypothetical protein ACPL88_09810, partial [Bryobacteraceae bacterium]